jgi:hypothetical protein
MSHADAILGITELEIEQIVETIPPIGICSKALGLLDSSEMVGHYGKNSNQIFNVLSDWNTSLEAECPTIYNQESYKPEP